MMRALLFVMVLGCAPSVELAHDFTYANGRVSNQTDPEGVELHRTEVGRPYLVLGDIEVTLRQQGSFGELPDEHLVDRELRRRAAEMGAHAVILVHYGRMGSSWWSWNELKGVGRAIRYR
jgi:hypothetical protein